MQINQVEGGVCAPQGFLAGGIHCGFAKKPGKNDLALIYSRVDCVCAASVTQNKVKAAPVLVTMEHLADWKAQAVICNSANANACAAGGEEAARRMCTAAARALNIPPEDVVVASTGVIGQPLDASLVEEAMPALRERLQDNARGSMEACKAIMTTDLAPKEIAVSFDLPDGRVHIGGIAKGSGMIHPNMATMLAFLTTDAAISPQMLGKALRTVVPNTFNMVSVDGDTSTNDMAVLMANGLAGNERIEDEGPAWEAFVRGLTHVCIYLARMMAKDGEGATKLLECVVGGAQDDETAKALAKSVVSSSLVKAAMYGSDANWGRVLCAMGYAGVELDPSLVDVTFVSRAGTLPVCKSGAGVPFDEDAAKVILLEDEIEIHLSVGPGKGRAVAWGCDLTHDYIKINGDYRS